MSDARTKIEILYKDVLGDMTELVNKVEALQESLPNVVKQTEHDLEGIVGALVAQARVYDAAILAKTNKVANDALIKVRGEVVDAKNDAIGDVRQAVREAVQTPVIDLVQDLNKAVNNINAQPRRIIKVAIGAGLISGLVDGLIVAAFATFYISAKEEAREKAAQVETVVPEKSMKKGSKQ